MTYQRKTRGLVLGDYLLLDPLGQGGMGKVFRARHRRMDRIVALKILPPSATGDPTAVQRFRREVKAAARLEHPNVVAAHDAGEDKGVHYLVMEYVPGDNLASVVRARGPLPVAEAVDFAIQAARGLAYAHARGIVHRDVKPHNLLLAPPAAVPSALDDADRPDDAAPSQWGLVKVLDMGLARIDGLSPTRPPAGSDSTAAMTHSGMIMGTAEFMAPEQAADARHADHRSDVYGLGCTLYFLLTGRHPFTGSNFMEVLLAHQMQPQAPLARIRPDVPEQLERVFHRMTAKNPADRFQNMDDLIHALHAVSTACSIGGDSAADPTATGSSVAAIERGPAVAAAVAARDDSRDKRHRPFDADRRRWYILGAAVGVVAIGAMILPGWLGGDRRQPPPSAQPPALTAPASSQEIAQAQRAWSDYLGTPIVDTNSLEMRLVLIPPGEFNMGSDQGDLAPWLSAPESAQWIEQIRSESPAHRVRITRPFYIGVTEVTVGQFRAFVRATGHRTDAERTGGWGVVGGQWRQGSEFYWADLGEQPLTDEHPALSISWNDATAFCRWLLGREKSEYDLPTEAQWEWAARAGGELPWPSGASDARLGDFAWFAGNASDRLHPVAQKLPHGFGLFDMFGNEREWCSDFYAFDAYERSGREDPQGPPSGELRVQRGGSALDSSERLRVTARNGSEPSNATHGAFRVIRVIPSNR
jgi:serine/threonine protein kinase